MTQVSAVALAYLRQTSYFSLMRNFKEYNFQLLLKVEFTIALIVTNLSIHFIYLLLVDVGIYIIF